MQKIVNKAFDETYYTETLDNGLRVIIWSKANFTTTNAVFASKYGALDADQIDENGEVFSSEKGTAHFLEHKCFESNATDVMTIFASMGANVNAYTSFSETAYYFTTSDEDIETPLNLLLDFVQNFDVTDQSVEKEKGIIIQELRMYEQMPDTRMNNEIFKALYHYYPLNVDIVGTEESIMAIHREGLKLAHSYNYHPSNMMLVVTTGQDPQKVMEIIEKNQSSKSFPAPRKMKRYLKEEPLEVVEQRKKIEMDVTTNKVAVAYKLSSKGMDVVARTKKEWEIRLALESVFSAMNPQYQSWINQKMINDTFCYEVDFSEQHAFIVFYCDDVDAEKFTSFVEENFKADLCDERCLQLLKHRYYASALRLFDQVEEISSVVLRNTFENISIFETLDILNQIEVADCQKSVADLCLKYRSIVEIVPIEKSC